MTQPALINKSALNTAWFKRWFIRILASNTINIKNKILICLKVDNAIIFLISQLDRVASLDISKVIPATIAITLFCSIFIILEEWAKRNAPAVTKVEECTRADVGVGAAIAAGNQALKGSCADFVNAINIIRIQNIFDLPIIKSWKEWNDPFINKMLIIKHTSPTRFINTVITLGLIFDLDEKKKTSKKDVKPNPSQPNITLKILVDIIKTNILKANNIINIKYLKILFLLIYLIEYVRIILVIKIISVLNMLIKFVSLVLCSNNSL